MANQSPCKPWTEAETVKLTSMYNSGADLETMAAGLSRTFRGVQTRCYQLGFSLTNRGIPAPPKTKKPRCIHCGVLFRCLAEDYLKGNRCFRVECTIMRPCATNFHERTQAGVSLEMYEEG